MPPCLSSFWYIARSKPPQSSEPSPSAISPARFDDSILSSSPPVSALEAERRPRSVSLRPVVTRQDTQSPSLSVTEPDEEVEEEEDASSTAVAEDALKVLLSQSVGYTSDAVERASKLNTTSYVRMLGHQSADERAGNPWPTSQTVRHLPD